VLSAPNKPERPPVELAVQELLTSLGFLIPHDFDEIEDLEARYWKEKRCSENLSLGLILTQKCNFRCVYCNQEHFGKSFSQQDADRVVALFRNEAATLKNFYVTWWGGEPLLKLDLIEKLSAEFIEVCDKSGIRYRAFTSTNGSLITPPVARLLRELRFVRFQISLDGPREFHDAQRPLANGKGTYDTVLSALANLHNAYPADPGLITLRVHTTALVRDSGADWCGFLSDLEPYKEILKVLFIPAHETFRFDVKKTISHDETQRRLADVMRDARARGLALAESNLLNRDTLMHCGAVSDRAWFVLPGSRLTRCNNAFNDPKNDCGIIGDQGNIELYGKAAEWIEHSPFKFDECKTCEVLPICMGGCRIVDFGHVSGARCHIKNSVKAAVLQDLRKTRYAKPKSFPASQTREKSDVDPRTSQVAR